MKKISNIINALSGMAIVGFALWVILSCMEIGMNNTTPGYVYSAWNIINLIF